MKHPIAVAFALVVAAGAVMAQDAGRWTGPYVGGSLGYGWGTGKTQWQVLPAAGDYDTSALKAKPHGFLVGPQLGYNWQRGNALLGIEGDVSWSGMDGKKRVSPLRHLDGSPYPASQRYTSEDINWFSTLRGRVGYLPSDKWFPYFTAGVAAADVDYKATFDGRPTSPTHYTAATSKLKVGWTAGLGAEWAMSEQWSAKVEYLYYDLGHASKTAQAQPIPTLSQINYKWDTKGHIARFGVNYRWGAPAPVVAPPPPPPIEEVKPMAPPPPPPPPPPAPEVKPVVVAPPPPPPQKIVLDQAVLHFANSRNELSPEGVEAVQQVARELQTYPGDYALVVSGHTSSTGSKAYNKALSKRRADAVANVLVDSGIPAASIETVGMGPDQPIMDNATAEGQARNRRVEIEVKVKDAAVETRTIQTQTQDTPAPRKKVIKKK